MTMFEKMRGTRLPEYYPTMYLDGYKPYEILETARNSIIKAHDAVDAEREADVPMNINFNVEVH